MYYKQTVSLYPTNWLPSSPPFNIALRTHQEALTNMVLAQSVRFEALLDELAVNGFIREERYPLLKGDNWEKLLKPERINAIKRQLNKVNDAEEEIKDWGTSE